MKKLVLSLFNLAVIGAIAWYCYERFEIYFTNPWTRDGQVRGQVIQVAPRISGPITNIAVIDNQYVQRGDLLFEIDARSFEIAVAQAKARLQRDRINSKASKIEYDRLLEIAKKDAGAVSAKDLNRREANYLQSLSQIEVGEEDLRNAELNLSYTQVHAAVDGYISNINFQIGDQAVANNPIVALVDSNSFWVFGYFRESEVGDIAIGDQAKVTLMAYPDQPLSGTVESIGWGIAPSDGNTGYNLLPSIKPVFQWIRLAQRIPVRVELGPLPDNVE
ncbi:MAG: HlyD family secretion protein, partial [Pseudomonadota bacterium]